MIEVGKSYQLKELIIRDGEEEISCMDENDTYKVLAKHDNIITCIGDKTNEVFTFMENVFIDPDNPEDNKIYMDTVKTEPKEVIEHLNKVINPKDLGFWKQLSEEGGGCACASSGGTGGCASAGGTGGCCCTTSGCGTTMAAISTGQSIGSSTMGTSASLGPAPNGPIGHIYGAMVNGIPVQGKSATGKNKKKKKKKSKKKDECYNLNSLLDKVYETYETEESQTELFDKALDKLNDYLNLPEMSDRTEAMLEYLDLLESIHTNELMDKYIEYAREHEVEDLSLDLIESTDDTIIISDEISTWLDRLNFKFADTKDIIYKREGNYKHLIKFDNDGNTLKYKILKDDETLLEKEWNLKDKNNVSNIFKAISKIIEEYE